MRNLLCLSTVLATGALALATPASAGPTAACERNAPGALECGVGSTAQGGAVALGEHARADEGDVAIGYRSISSILGLPPFAWAVGGLPNVAVGFRSLTVGDGNLALGAGAQAAFANDQGYSPIKWAIALGGMAKASQDESIAIGGHAQTNERAAIALGNKATATGISIGAESFSGHYGSTAIGQKAKADHVSTAVGYGAVAESEDLAIGINSQARKGDIVPLFVDTDINSNVAIGNLAYSSGNGNVSLGFNAITGIINDDRNLISAAEYATALGYAARGLGNGATVLGAYASANEYAMALGYRSNANGTGATALGVNASAQHYGVAIGQNASTNPHGVALGLNSQSHMGGISIGSHSIANAETVAIGVNTSATGVNSVALGKNSIATEDNVVSIGSDILKRRLINLDDGIADTDAVNVRQLNTAIANVSGAAGAAQATADTALVNAAAAQTTADTALANAATAQTTANTARAEAATAQTTANTARAEAATAQGTADTALANAHAIGNATAAGLGGGATYNMATGTLSAPSYTIQGAEYNNVGAALSAIDTTLDRFDDRLVAINTLVDKGFERANGGIAASMALGGTMVVPDKRWSVSLNLSTYRDEQGFSGSIVWRAADNIYMNAGIAGSTVSGTTGGRVGIAFGW